MEQLTMLLEETNTLLRQLHEDITQLKAATPATHDIRQLTNALCRLPNTIPSSIRLRP